MPPIFFGSVARAPHPGTHAVSFVRTRIVSARFACILRTSVKTGRTGEKRARNPEVPRVHKARLRAAWVGIMTGESRMIRVYLIALTLMTVLIGIDSAAAQQDGNGNELIEVCVAGWGHNGETSYVPYEVTLEELEEIAAGFHTTPYQGNADGTCPPLEQAQSLEIVYCVWTPSETLDENGIPTQFSWQREWHSLPYFIQDFQTNGANIAPFAEDSGCPTEPLNGTGASEAAA
jgi:hypothetical protein